MYCVYCGNQVEERFAFCPKCGKSIYAPDAQDEGIPEFPDELEEELGDMDLVDFLQGAKNEMSHRALRELFVMCLALVQNEDGITIWVDPNEKNDWLSCDIFDDKYSIIDMTFSSDYLALLGDQFFRSWSSTDTVEYEGQFMSCVYVIAPDGFEEYFRHQTVKTRVLDALKNMSGLSKFEKNLKDYGLAAISDLN